jgi:hypothetical protein
VDAALSWCTVQAAAANPAAGAAASTAELQLSNRRWLVTMSRLLVDARGANASWR